MPLRIFLLPTILSVTLFAFIHFKFSSSIDVLIESNQEFIQKINMGISHAPEKACNDRVIQLKNLETMAKTQNEAFQTYKVGGYINGFFILVASLFGARVGYSARKRDA